MPSTSPDLLLHLILTLLSLFPLPTQSQFFWALFLYLKSASSTQLISVGKAVGESGCVAVGYLLGDSVGEALGDSVGDSLGESVGAAEGGSLVGQSVGTEDGNAVGDWPGGLLGTEVGTELGRSEGA